MRTTTTVHVESDTRVEGYILEVGGVGRVMYLKVADSTGEDLTFIIRDLAFLDKLSNECERLTREFIGDIPPLEPLHATGQYCECGACEVADVPSEDYVPTLGQF